MEINGQLKKKQEMSILKKEQYKHGLVKINLEGVQKAITNRNKNWKEHPELKEQMKEKVRKAITKYYIY